MKRTRRLAAHAIALLAFAATPAAADPNVTALDLDLWAQLLARHTRATNDVAGTRVDYAALRIDPAWPKLLASLANAPDPPDAPPNSHSDAPNTPLPRVASEQRAARSIKLVYWINAYNILAIDVVAQHFPVASIRDVGSLLRPVWKRDAGRAAGRMRTLDEIEHEILRPMGDPRVHAAIVCASTSCPSLAREPYRTATLDAQLDAAARAFVANPDKGARVESQRLRLSPIFEWFAGDFAATGGVLAFVRRHATPELGAAIERLGPDPQLVYFDYDWSLNGIGRPSR